MIPEKIQLQKKKKKFENYSSKYTPKIFKKKIVVKTGCGFTRAHDDNGGK